MAMIYANENFRRSVVVELRQLGHDVITIQERDLGGLKVSDPQVLQYATHEGRAVLTFNRRDFIRLHNQNSVHAGIIVCTYDPDCMRLANRVHSAIAGLASLHGQLIRIHRPAR